jgi:hypothetical protein
MVDRTDRAERRVGMALARVVAFEGVTQERIDQLREELSRSSGPPEEVPATELLILHDPQGGRSLAVLLFDSESDYARGDEALTAMPTDETPGRRVSVDKYEVAIRVSAGGATP